MLTKKLRHKFVFDEELMLFQRHFNSVVHFAFNRYADSKGVLKDSEVEKLVKDTMNHIETLDASFVKQAVLKAKSTYLSRKNGDGNCEGIVFGGKWNFFRRIRNLISREEFRKEALLPVGMTGSRGDSGNRKFSLDLRNHRIVFKKDKSHHYDIPLNAYSKEDERLLFKLQDRYDENPKSMPFTVELDDEFVYLTFEESEFRNETYQGISGRTASIDMNPNYVALVIQDENGVVFKKRIYSVKSLNDFDSRKYYRSKEDKVRWRRHLNDKRKHETLQICKDIAKTCVHYKVDSFVIEDLDIKSKDSGKGKRYNKLCLNHWQRNLLFNNLRKRCNLNGINFHPVYAGYSSIKGQLEHDEEVDSIAAAMEIGVRKGKDLRKFGDSVVELGRLSNRWKNEMESNFKQAPSWTQVSEFLKKKFKNSSYRNFFSDCNPNIGVSYSLITQSSYVKSYDFI